MSVFNRRRLNVSGFAGISTMDAMPSIYCLQILELNAFYICRNVILNYFFLLMNCFFEDGDREPVQVCGINVVVENVFFYIFV